MDALIQECPYPVVPGGKLLNQKLTDLLKDYHAALKDCNDDKASLRNLLSEPKKNEP